MAVQEKSKSAENVFSHTKTGDQKETGYKNLISAFLNLPFSPKGHT